jgi:hypothetical protein
MALSQSTRLSRPPETRLRACPRCGDAFEVKPRGRPQKWCSSACRRAAHAERVAAEYACLAVEVVETVDVLEHDLDECVSRVAASPTACKRILRAITELARAHDLATDPRWEPALKAHWQLHDAVMQRHAYWR